MPNFVIIHGGARYTTTTVMGRPQTENSSTTWQVICTMVASQTDRDETDSKVGQVIKEYVSAYGAILIDRLNLTIQQM